VELLAIGLPTAYQWVLARERSAGEVLKKVARVLLAVLAVILIFIFFISLPLGLQLFFSTPPGRELLAKHVRRLYFFVLALPVEVPIRLPVSGLLLALMVIFALCFLAAALQAGGVHKAVMGSLDRPLMKSMQNFLFAMPFVATGTLVGTMGLIWLMDVLGLHVAPTFEVGNVLELLLNASYAAVVEELGIRLLGIGLPLAIAAALKAGEEKGLVFLKGLFCPPALSEDIRRALRPLVWLLVIATSLLFGFLHLLGWTVGKVPVATAAGLVLGICFVSYGLHASILIHWFMNYHIQVFGAWAYLTEDPGAAAACGLTFMLEMGVGVLSLIMFLVQGIRFYLSRQRAREEAEKPAIAVPSAWYRMP